jgi:hypothetical protein
MPYKVLKRGDKYVLKSSSGREYKHKTLAKARAQKRLLEEKDAKVIQKQSVKQTQRVVVNINQPSGKTRAPARTGVARPDKAPLPERISMIPAVLPSASQIAYELQILNRQSSAPRTDIFQNREDAVSNLAIQPVPPSVPPIDGRQHYFDFDQRYEDTGLDPTLFIPRVDKPDGDEVIDTGIRGQLERFTKTRLIEIIVEKTGARRGISGTKEKLIDRIISQNLYP